MCWSGEASMAVAAVGVVSGTYFFFKEEQKAFSFALLYFSLMEMIQAYSYTVIGECQNPNNQMATLLAYIHISFQPFFFNAIALCFIPPAVAKKIAPFAYTLCLTVAVMFLVRIYPIDWGYNCHLYRWSFPWSDHVFNMPFCGNVMCTVPGEWHLAWQAPAKDTYFAMATGYWIVAFFVPMLYGAWRISLYQVLIGPILVFSLVKDANEAIAVWCLYSVGLILLILLPPVKRLMKTERWPGWKFLQAKKPL